jgi:predicted nucleotidyltransferase component of viral defense system
MIERDEIQAKAVEFGLHWSNIQRDYVFGWLIGGLFEVSSLRDVLALKGGNALRKAYFPATRFSDDIDFTTTQGLDPEALLAELNEVCRFAEARSGVKFDLERNRLVDTQLIERGRRIYKLRLYFRDFSGNAAHIPLKVKVDVTEYDRILLPLERRRLIHQYSDAGECSFDIRAVKLEEALADKMKCLIQRRYAYDLFDLVYGVFINRELEVDRSELVQTFLRKTIFERSPVAARDLLLGVPFDLLRGFWGKIVCPKSSLFTFESAVSLLRDGLMSLFQPFSWGAQLGGLYFPAEFRNPILQAGSELTLLRAIYDGITREVEPYSLVFKQRQDGLAREYFYCFDRTGGHTSGPSIKSWTLEGLQRVENTNIPFEPRYAVELRKAGDSDNVGYFGQPFGSRPRRPRTRNTRVRSGPTYTIQCPYCSKRFTRKTPSTRLNKHQDGYGNPCYGRVGIHLFERR